MRVLALTWAFVGAGCAPITQVPAPTASPTHPTLSAPVASTATTRTRTPAPTRPPDFEWARAVAPIEYNSLPASSRGQWTIRAPLARDQQLLLLVPNDTASEDDRAKFVPELARLDVKAKTITTLVRLQAGTTAAYAIVSGAEFVWIETSPVDLRAYGWRLHRTNWQTGSDQVVAGDPGLRPDQSTSLLPALAFDGSNLLFTVLAQSGSELTWELRRIREGQQSTIARLADPGRQRILQVASRDTTTVWAEQSIAQGAPVTTLGISDGSTARRVAPPLNIIYRLAVTTDTIFFATDRGVLRAQRGDPAHLEPISVETSNTDQLELIGKYVVYNNFDAAQSVAAIDLTTGAHSVLAQAIAYGPVAGNGTITWFERPIAGRPARVARTSL